MDESLKIKSYKKQKEEIDRTAHMEKAKRLKDDEFYTFYKDIEEEMKYFKDDIKGKRIYCPCDDPIFSNFYLYFIDNFKKLSLQELYFNYLGANCIIKVDSTNIDSLLKEREKENRGIEEYGIKIPLKEEGDFVNIESIEIMKKKDTIVITNPPFSNSQILKDTLIENDVDYIILDSLSACAYKTNYRYIKDKKMFVSPCKSTPFGRPDGTVKTVPVNWVSSFNTYKIREQKLNKKPVKKVMLPKRIENLVGVYEVPKVSMLEDLSEDFIKDKILALPLTFFRLPYEEDWEIVLHEEVKLNSNFKKLKQYYTKDDKFHSDVKNISVEADHNYVKINKDEIKGKYYLKDEDDNYYKKLFRRVFIKRKV